jgi:hypothetical protein
LSEFFYFGVGSELKSTMFDAFVPIWEWDYLSLSKPSTEATMRGQVKRLKNVFGSKELRQIGVADVQQLVAKMGTEGFESKTTRNLWSTLRLVLEAALAQAYPDRVLPKPKLPRATKKRSRYFRLTDAARIIAAVQGENQAFTVGPELVSEAEDATLPRFVGNPVGRVPCISSLQRFAPRFVKGAP